MPPLGEIYLAHPAWSWAGAAAALLATEMATGSGWLLWPAAAAGLVAVAAGFMNLSTTAEVMTFAGLTIVSTVTARRYFPRQLRGHSHDINDNVVRLVGHRGRVVAPFSAGAGRVFVDGKEWAAELTEGEAPEVGASVEVTAVSGARLAVRGILAQDEVS
jgi:membrane protein implicated in regulation of membrane protease activity